MNAQGMLFDFASLPVRALTAADFHAWDRAMPAPDYRVTGYDHARYMRWCQEMLAKGHRIDDSAAVLPPLRYQPEEAAVQDLESSSAAPELEPDASCPEPCTAAAAAPLVAYTDGSGTVKQLPCGAGVVIYDGDLPIIEASRFLGPGTNNRAELSAVGLALAITAELARPLVIRTDSEYTRGALTRADDTDPGRPNARLINHIRAMLRGRAVQFEHVPGHAGIAGNERADVLAGRARRSGIRETP